MNIEDKNKIAEQCCGYKAEEGVILISHIIKIVEEYAESRTCDGCKHYVYDEEACYSEDVNKYSELRLRDINPHDFGCNKWESK